MHHFSRTLGIVIITIITYGSAFAEDGILVLHIADPRGKPIPRSTEAEALKSWAKAISSKVAEGLQKRVDVSNRGNLTFCVDSIWVHEGADC